MDDSSKAYFWGTNLNDRQANIATFSVIMPLYNQADFVGQAVESVLAQTNPDWELVIVDDGSTDSGGRLADDFAARDSRIRCIHRKNGGASVARNTAIAASQSPWITYLDSDDAWFPSALASYAEYIKSHPGARFIYGYRHRLNEDGSITESPVPDHQARQTGTVDLFQRMYLMPMCVCHRRELLDEAGPYQAGLSIVEDYDIYLRMSLHCRFEPVVAAIGLRRRHGGNISVQTGYSRMLEAELLKRFVERQGGKDLLSRDVVAARLGKLYYASGRQHFKAGCYRKALAALRLAGRYRTTFKGRCIAALSRCMLPFSKDDGKDFPKL